MAPALFNYFNRIAKVPSTEKMETEIESKIGEDINGPIFTHSPVNSKIHGISMPP